MPRYFIAIPLPDEARDRLVAVQPPAVPSMRLLGREELHLTLHFLGEVAAQDLGNVRTALATVRTHSFTIAVNGIGKFQQEGRPQVLWAGVEANAALIALHRSIGAAMADAIGFRPEERPYSPHLTLARLNGPVPPDVIDGYLEGSRGFVIPSVPIDRFVLYSSDFAQCAPISGTGGLSAPQIFIGNYPSRSCRPGAKHICGLYRPCGNPRWRGPDGTASEWESSSWYSRTGWRGHFGQSRQGE